MNKLANVVYAYKSSNDDELELNVGDKIEVIGFEEEGWWKGKLKGRIGVFPSNFVQVIESSPATQSVINSSSNTQQQTPNSNNIISSNNKGLNLFGSKSSRNSLSTNSLNSNSNNNSLINTSGITNHSINNHNHNNNNNLMMNNTQQQDSSGLICAELDPQQPQATITSSERRAKPIRGIGYGDIFAAGGIKPKPLPADPITGNLASDRLNSSLTNPLLKQVPRKPPPPTPANSLPTSVAAAVTSAVSSANTTIADAINGTSNDQAPALPPKPANQFSPLVQQHSRPPLPAQHQQSSARQLQHQQQQQQQQQVREQARVVYAYEPANDDELAMQVGDIIDIIDKDIEDAGWWKGELRGKVGVFPDNFVKLIEVPEVLQQATIPSTNNQQEDWRHQHRVSNLSQPITSTYNHQAPTNLTEVKLKSVFAATPKGFSKELESNLEKQTNGAASFLSLKRNKLQQQLPSTGESNTMNETNGIKKEPENTFGSSNSDGSNSTKLSHITANRAKGPSRRPPSNILNKRNQLDQTPPGLMIKRETNGKDDLSPESLPQIDSLLSSNQSNNSNNNSNNHDNNLSSSPPGHQQSLTTATSVASTLINNSNNITKPNTDALTTPVKPSLSLDNVIDNQALLTPKTSLRANPTLAGLDKGKPLQSVTTPVLTATTPTTAASSSTTNSTPPPWMVELRKAHAEKKRDSVAVTPAQQGEDEAIISSANAMKAAVTTTAPPSLSSDRPNTQPAPTTVVVDQVAPIISSTQYDNLVKQISKHVSGEISELKEEVKKLHKEVKGIDELKSVLEVMKIELKACQSATENQRRYIKELVNNLADERKKIAAMQDEIDRTLK